MAARRGPACNGTDPAMRLPDIALLDVLIDTENPDVLYVGSDIGVFFFIDSTMISVSPSADLAPGSTRIFHTLPGTGLSTAVAPAGNARRARDRPHRRWP